MRPIRIAPPEEMPVSLDRLKAHLRVDHFDEDDLIASYMQAAVDHLDGWQGLLGRCMVTQTWRLDAPDGVSGSVVLPFPDVVAVAATDADGAAVAVALREGAGGTVVMLDRAAVKIDMTAGFGAAADVPEALKVAILILAGDLYEGRTSQATEGTKGAVDRLIGPYRWGRV